MQVPMPVALIGRRSRSFQESGVLIVLCCVTICVTMELMPSINIRELRDTRRLKAWLREGKTIELRERREVFARIVPERTKPAANEWPDFGGRRRRIFGERLLPGADLVIEERGRF